MLDIGALTVDVDVAEADGFVETILDGFIEGIGGGLDAESELGGGGVAGSGHD